MNRLHLDFTIDSAENRKNFLDEYLQRAEFISNPPTEDELEMMGNYLLWGRAENGKNSVQNKLVQIQTRNGTWDKDTNESLDALLESPTFNESQIFELNTTKLRVIKQNFNRIKTLKECPEELKQNFITLFGQIDRLELLLNYYDILHNKRKTPPRKELEEKFSKEEIEAIKEEILHINQYKYLKMRHQLVELRKQQFILKDSYSSIIQLHNKFFSTPEENKISFETDIEVYPLGIYNNSKISKLIFKENINLDEYNEEELRYISDFIWNKKKISDKKYIDFRKSEHIYEIISLFFDLEDEILKKEIDSETESLLRTLKFYIDTSNLSNIQKDILDFKKRKIKNEEIARIINNKYNKSYSSNYISTIFKQKIISKIALSAEKHEKIFSNIFFPENFKKCNTCGKILLKDADNFIKKTKSKDGLSNRCKFCDKIDREKRKK